MPPGQPTKKRALVFLFLFAALYVLLFCRYSFPSTDHSTQLTAVYHFFDNQLYQKDFSMQLINPVSVKTLPHLVLFLISRASFLPVSLVYFSAFVVVTYLVFLLCYLVAFKLSGDEVTSSLACLLLAVFARNYTLASSGFIIVASALVPYYIALPIHFLCFYLFLRKRYLLAVVASGACFYIHLQISIFTLISVLACVAFIEKNIRQVLRYFILFLVLISPNLVALASKFGVSAPVGPEYSIYELSKLRVFHHIFSNYVRLSLFAWIIASTAIMLHSAKFRFKKETGFWIGSLMAIYIAGIVFVRLLPVDFVMLMYCLRVDVFLRIFFFVLLSIVCCDFARLALKRRSFRVLGWPWSVFLAAQLVFLTVAYVRDPLDLKVLDSIDNSRSPQAAFYDYVKENTPKSTLFIISPYTIGFRLYSQRSVVVDHKTNPIGWGGLLQDEWVERMLDVCNVKKSRHAGFGGMSRCGKGFASLTRRDFSRLCGKYEADYIVSASHDARSLGEDIFVCKKSGLSLFRCPEE